MSLTDDLTSEVVQILKAKWSERDGNKVPEQSDLQLANDAVKLVGTVLYADLADSTGLVLAYKPTFAAEVYKDYLNCACRIIRHQNGEVTAFDGDRVMAVFLGAQKNTNAVRAALAINHAVVDILNPKMRDRYQGLPRGFAVKQAVGIDTSALFVARTGIRGADRNSLACWCVKITRARQRNAQTTLLPCRAKVKMSGFSQMKMSGSGTGPRHVAGLPDDEQTRAGSSAADAADRRAA
jgi:class 3 adenylate cyclase